MSSRDSRTIASGPKCLEPQLRRLKYQGGLRGIGVSLKSWRLESSRGIFSYVSGV